MGKVKFIIFCFIFFQSFQSLAVKDTLALQLKPVKTIMGNYTALYVDNLSNIF